MSAPSTLGQDNGVLLSVNDLSISYDSIRAVKGISFDVREGEIVTLIGANGAGKSSTLRAISGVVPYKGTIHYKVKSRDAAGNEAASPDATFQTPPASGTGVGQQAPDFTLPGTDATNIALKDLRGGKVIINFWAYNCSPCRSEMPLIQQMHEKYPTVPIIAVCGPQLGAVNKYQVGDLITTSNYTFTVALDETGQVGTDYNISSVPKTFMLDSTGIVRKIQDGSFQSFSQMEGLYTSY